MSILEIDDILYEIVNHIDIDIIFSLIIVNKSCHRFIINTNIHKELNILQKRFPNFHNYKKLSNIELLCELNLVNILKKEFILVHNYDEIIMGASKHGRVNLLQFFIKHNHEIQNFESAMNVAVEKGHVNVLEWFYDSDYKFKNCKIAIRIAMQNGQVDVIKWFCKMGYWIKYSKRYASILYEKTITKHDYLWYYNEDNIYKYTDSDVKFIIKNDHFDLFKWLFELDNGLKLSDTLIEYIIAHDCIHILDWIKDKGFDFQYSPNVLEYYSFKNKVNVFEWLQKNEIIIKITNKLVVRATIFGYINVLEFLNTHELNYYHSNNKQNDIRISEFKHFKNFVYSICWTDLQHISSSCKIADFDKYENSLNWYRNLGIDVDQIEWIQRMKIVKYRDTVQFSW